MKTGIVFKKILSLVILVILLLAYSVPVIAESQINFNEKVQIKNNVIFYEIEISPNSNICALSFEIKYSEDQIKVNNCTLGEILDGGIAKTNSSIEGKVILTYISLTPLTDGGTIFLIEFDTLSSDNINIDIEFIITECIDTNCNDIAYTVSGNKISNPKYIGSSQNQNINTSDNSTSNNDNSGPDLSTTEKLEPNGIVSKDTGEEIDQNNTNNIKNRSIIWIFIGTILLVICLIMVKLTLLKNKKENKK